MLNEFIEDYNKCKYKENCICRHCIENYNSGYYHYHRCITNNYLFKYYTCKELDKNGNQKYKKI